MANRVRNLLLNILGSSLLAFGVCAFIIPFDLIVGGATGISLILHKLTAVEVSKIAFLINVVFLAMGLIFGGKRLVIGSVISSLVYPAALAVFEQIPAISTLADTRMMAALCGGVVCGAGIGIVMYSGGSTGGVDIPILIVHKFFHVPVNKLMKIVDITIMILQIPFSVLTNVLYGIVYTLVMTNTLNKVLTYGADRIKLTVVSEAFEEISRKMIENDFGLTLIYAEGGYTKTPIKKIESVMLTGQLRKAKRVIREVDPEAFITVENVIDVRGRGFTMERVFIDLED